MEPIIIYPKIKITKDEYIRSLGCPSHYIPDTETEKLMDEAAKWYKENDSPWVFLFSFTEIIIRKNSVSLDGQVFNSDKLANIYTDAGVSSVYAAALSAGSYCEEKLGELKKNGLLQEQYFLDAYTSAVINNLTQAASDKVSESVGPGKTVLPHYGPGYTGWSLEQQYLLWELFARFTGFKDKLGITESGMLKPVKSMLVIYGVTDCCELTGEVTVSGCNNCSLPECSYKKE